RSLIRDFPPKRKAGASVFRWRVASFATATAASSRSCPRKGARHSTWFWDRALSDPTRAKPLCRPDVSASRQDFGSIKCLGYLVMMADSTNTTTAEKTEPLAGLNPAQRETILHFV